MAGSEARIWERLAREDAEFYIDTRRSDYRSPEAMEAFFASGREDASRILEEAESSLPGRGAALEIGCGVGRITLGMAPAFERVRAVDISPTMLGKLKANCTAAGAAHVEGFLVGEPWDEGQPIDLAYSRWVLQHISDFGAIEEHVRRIARALAEGGVAHLQFDTRPRNLLYRTRNLLPDFVLPRVWRRGVRRIRRDPAEIRELLARHGLRPVREIDEHTAEHVFIAVKG
jgi:SAM-dependent methyltransferase